MPGSIIRSNYILFIYKENDGLRVDFGALQSLEYEKSRACTHLNLDLSKSI